MRSPAAAPMHAVGVMTSSMPRLTRSVRSIHAGLVGLAVAGLVAFVVAIASGAGASLLVGRWLMDLSFAAGLAACAWRAATVPEDRGRWLLITAALASWLVGDTLWEVVYRGDASPPWPSLADAFYIGFYPFFAAALIVEMRAGERRLRTVVALDVAAGALVAGALATALLYPVLRDATTGSPAAVATNLAYPLGDLVLMVLAAVGIALTGGRAGWGPTLVMAGLAGFVAADVAYLFAADTYGAGGLTDVGWVAGAALLGAASLSRRARGSSTRRDEWWLIVAPVLFALCALGILLVDHFAPANPVIVVLAALGLVAIVARMAITFLDGLHLLHQRERDVRTDQLTGLANRLGFAEHLERELARAARHGRAFAVFLVDLDNFKYFNDTLGHGAGDDLLAAAAARLEGELRAGDVVARISGDEFAGLLHDTGAEGAAAFAERLCAAVRSRPLVAGMPGQVTVSVGIAVVDPLAGLASWEEALARADTAMYAAKEHGRDRWSLYEEGDSLLEARFNWSEAIRRALDDDRGLELHAQPIVDVATGAVWGHELLLRYVDAHGHVSLPGAFLAEAERFGLMARLDVWVVTRAAALAAASETKLTANVSGSSVEDPKAAAAIIDAIEHSRVPRGRLVIELTETTAIENGERAADFAAALNRLGCGLALDDFGVGYASFRYLKEIPFDIVKIDGDFIRSIATDSIDRLLTQSIVDVARSLGKLTVAECVDSEEVLKAVTDTGVDLVQGFHLGRPAPVDGGRSRPREGLRALV
jgi:diguanylate cyclase (GGDEF)-like protein